MKWNMRSRFKDRGQCSALFSRVVERLARGPLPVILNSRPHCICNKDTALHVLPTGLTCVFKRAVVAEGFLPYHTLVVELMAVALKQTQLSMNLERTTCVHITRILAKVQPFSPPLFYRVHVEGRL